MSECNCVDTGHKQDCPLGKDLRIAAMQEEIATLQSDLAAARQEIAALKKVAKLVLFYGTGHMEIRVALREAGYLKEEG